MAGDSVAGGEEAAAKNDAGSVAAESIKSPVPSSRRSTLDQRPRLSRARTNPILRQTTPAPAAAVSYSYGAPLEVMVHPNPVMRTWQRLEAIRLRKLGCKALPRNFMVAQTYGFQPIQQPASARSAHVLPPLRREATTSLVCQPAALLPQANSGNEVAPFSTMEKPTCGYFFSFGTNHKKIRHGLNPANIPQWRSVHYTSS